MYSVNNLKHNTISAHHPNNMPASCQCNALKSIYVRNIGVAPITQYTHFRYKNSNTQGSSPNVVGSAVAQWKSA